MGVAKMTESHEEHIERELKFTLNGKREFERLKSKLPEPKEIVFHENIYFDTSGRLLGKNGWALRVRLISDKTENLQAEITAKGLAQGRGFLSQRPEISSPVELATAIDIVGGRYDLFSMESPAVERIRKYAASEKLIPLVSFKNTRSKIPFPKQNPFCIVEMDETFFSENLVEYEIEIESNDSQILERASTEFQTFLNDYNIDYRPGEKSKLERALELSGALDRM